MNIGFTGTQKGMTSQQYTKFVELINSLGSIDEFHSGCCIGADTQADTYIWSHHPKIFRVLHPPIISTKTFINSQGNYTILPSKPYLERNRAIVDNTKLLIATPSTSKELIRSGTWSTIRYARKLKREIYIIDPPGSILRC
jgi:hypothetical protein